MPVKLLITEGSAADCSYGEYLMDGIEAKGLLADRGYDSNKIVNDGISKGMKVVILARKNRKIQGSYDHLAYKFRYVVEKAFLHLKRWRGINRRYAKNASSFLAAIHICCIALWGEKL